MLLFFMLEQIRKLFGYTQDDLAKKIGISQNYYTQIETGSAKSAPVIAKISNELKIKESFLTSLGEYVEYPFLSDFYTFQLIEQRIVQSYKFLIEYICSKSKCIDIVFFLVRGGSYRTGLSPIFYIALKDDHGTLFLFKRRSKSFVRYAGIQRRESKEIESRTFPLIDFFREELYKIPSTYVYEQTILTSDELFNKIENIEVSREDILPYFPDLAYFDLLYRAHKEIKSR